MAHIPSRPAQLADTAAEEMASRVTAIVRVMVEKDARTVTRIVNLASLVHMWRTKTVKFSCKNGTFLNNTTRIQS